jgi:predicted amidophosphoribosyltransferase
VAEESHSGHSLGAWLAAAGDAVVSIFYPAGCELCDRLLIRASRVPICEECLTSFAALPAQVCAIGGAPAVTPFSTDAANPSEMEAGSAVPHGCLGCQGRPYAFERARSYAAYEGKLIRAVVMLKFERVEPLAGWFATSSSRCRCTVKDKASVATTRRT